MTKQVKRNYKVNIELCFYDDYEGERSFVITSTDMSTLRDIRKWSKKLREYNRSLELEINRIKQSSYD